MSTQQVGLILAGVGTFMIFMGFAPGLHVLVLVGAALGTGGVIVAAFGSMGNRTAKKQGETKQDGNGQ